MSAAKSAADQAAGSDEPQPSCVRTILSVDDSQTNRCARAGDLRAAGFEVIEAENGSDALRLAAEKQPSLVLLDPRLPDMNGFEVCRRLKSDPGTASIPVINISDVGRFDDDLPLALKHGADTYLREPVEPAMLVATVEAVIQARAEQRQRELAQRGKAEQMLRDREAQFRTLANSIPQLCSMANADEEALRQSVERLEKVLEVETIGVMFWDLNTGCMVDANDTFFKLMGYSRSEVEARELRWQNLTPPEYMDVSRAEIEKFLATGHVGPYEKEYFHKDGTRRWLLFAGSSLGNNQCVEFCVDISDRKQAEQALRQSEEKFRMLIEQASDAFFLADGNGRLLEVNRQACESLGYAREELLRMCVSDIEQEIDERTAKQTWGQSEPGKPYTLQGHHRRKDGTAFPVEIRLSAHFSGGQKLHLGLVRDITERKRAEEALQEREREFRELAESMPQFVWVTDANGMALFLNHRWEEQLGVAVEEMLGDGWARILHPDDRERVLNLWYRCASTGEHYETEYRFRTVTGEYRRFLARGVPIRDEQGRIRRWFGTCTDIEDTKRSEERLRQSQKLESVGLLAGGIAHDFNNLLTGVMGNASLLLEDAEPERAEMLRSIITSTERAAHLTRQLLAYSGKGQFVVRELDITQAVNEMADLVQFSIPKSADLRLDLQRRLPPVAMDPGQLQQILMNLVINAGDAIGNGNPGRITVTTSMADVQSPFTDELGEEIPPGRYVCIEVRDTGSGIDPEKKAKIFDPFFTTKFVGRGLGLAAIAGILRSQKGGIVVESALGKGSTFKVFLPAAGKPGLVVQEPGSQDGRPAILVIDDEVAVRDFISAVLRRKGYQVVQASDGQEALAVVGSAPGAIDAAIVDIIMPNMSTNDLLPALKAKQPGMRILLTSGYSEVEARRLCAAYPGAAFIQKPYTAQQLARAVDELVGGSLS